MNQKASSEEDPIITKRTRTYDEYNKAGMKFLKEVFENPKILDNKNVYKKILRNLNKKG